MARIGTRTVESPREAPGPPDDVGGARPPAAWWGAVVRARQAPARVRGITLRLEHDWSDVVVLTAVNIPGQNVLPAPGGAMPLLVEYVARFPGEAIALVAAPSREKALAAAAQVCPELAPHPTPARVADPLHSTAFTRGEPEAVKGGQRIEGDYLVGPPPHAPRPDARVTVWVPEQGPVRARVAAREGALVREALRAALGAEEVELEPAPSGVTADPIRAGLEAAWAGLLSQRCGAPVRMAQDPAEPGSGPAGWPLRAQLLAQVDDTGRLLALSAALELDAGAYAGLAPQAAQHAVEHALGAYRCPQVRVEARVSSSPAPPPSASPETAVAAVTFALERHLDRVARALALDPEEVRRVNLGPEAGAVAALELACRAWEESPAPPLREAPGAGGEAARRLGGRGLALGRHTPDEVSGGPAPQLACASVDLAVDLDTGEVVVRRVLLAVDSPGAGEAPPQAVGGAVVRAVRWALGPLPGRTLAVGPEPQSAADCPEIRVLPEGHRAAATPLEPALAGAVAAAVAQALESATGALLDRLPMPSDLTLEATP